MSSKRFSLDRLRAGVYIAASIIVASCVPPLAPLVTVALVPAPASEASAWARRTEPDRDMAIRFRFTYKDKRRDWGGRGTARVAPPDSLRFDYTGPLGLGSGAAVVVGDSTQWAQPEQNFRSFIPAIRMLWAALGVVRPPDSTAAVAVARVPPRTIWRFGAGLDTIDYVVTDGPEHTLEAEWRHAGKIQARSQTELDVRGRATAARVLFPEASARFELTVVGVDTTAVFAPSLWQPRR